MLTGRTPGPAPGLTHVLPVIDLKRGQVVHGVAGNRDEYAPQQSQLVDSAAPGPVASALCAEVGCCDVYVADLDAIAGESLDHASYTAIRDAGAEIWLDAGIRPSVLEARLAQASVSLRRVIIALETLGSLRELKSIRDASPAVRLTFSLDLRNGTPMTADPSVKRMAAEDIAACAFDYGFDSMIVLDLAGVGSGSGGQSVIELCRKIRAPHDGIELISGGGVRNTQDVNRFVEAGCDRVLVATALHQGVFRREA